ncbi:SIMPL domain-containing protein [Microbacterium telephonicum]|uniref:Uncharacterized protein n=1 Tax=Microbacterium telephonicum TaxID=1714841 RepID=A0A498C346_9MICO|nr:SIMPL domain-containing protein [Microbacterium telephonicum]RLK49429.1 hypothetical protein C7474_1579 [Microbacterium telephonicum]
MSEVVITVRGSHETRVAPEQARAHVTVAVDGPTRGGVVEALATAAEPLRTDLKGRLDDGRIVEWSSGQASVWSNRPWNDAGQQLPLVHHASVRITALFDDFPALSHWLDTVASLDGVQIDHVEWMLTPDTRVTVERETAAAAVASAVLRASAYASAIGRDTVVPVEIADVGLLHPEPVPMMARASFAGSASDAAPAIDLRPEDVVIGAAVEARFTTG